MRRPPSLVLLLVVALGAASCSVGDYDRQPDVSVDELPSTTTTKAPDFSGVALPAVPGSTTTTVDAGPGRAVLQGTVTGPDGAVPNATVRAEWLAGDTVIAKDAHTGPDGRWRIEKVPGGRYRARAWRAPDLVGTNTELFLVANGEEHTVDFRVESFGGRKVDTALAPATPRVGEPVNLVVRVAERRVDDQGVGRAQPLAGIGVELFGRGSWSLATPNPASTAGDGAARFTLTCRRPGPNPLSAVVGGDQVIELSIPDCTPGAEPESEGSD